MDAATRPAAIEIRPYQGFSWSALAELWGYRDLVWVMAARDLRVRYKQTLLGVAWVIMPPLLTMLVFNLLFGVLLGPDGRPGIAGVPYALTAFCALVPWQLFANAVRASGSSLINNRSLISRVYFPRLVAPVAPVAGALVDFAIAFAVLLLLLAGYAMFTPFTFSWRPALLMLPVFTGLAVVTALSVSIWLAALGAMYRDFNLAGPYGIQLLMFLTPVVYSYDSVSAAFGAWGPLLFGINPMSGVVEGFRWALLGGAAPPWPLLLTGCVMDLLLLAAGLRFFQRAEQTIADVI